MSKMYTAQIKKVYELEDFPIGSRVILVFDSSDEYHGIFRGFDGDNTIMLKSEGEKPSTIGLPFDRLKLWLLKD